MRMTRATFLGFPVHRRVSCRSPVSPGAGRLRGRPCRGWSGCLFYHPISCVCPGIRRCPCSGAPRRQGRLSAVGPGSPVLNGPALRVGPTPGTLRSSQRGLNGSRSLSMSSTFQLLVELGSDHSAVRRRSFEHLHHGGVWGSQFWSGGL